MNDLGVARARLAVVLLVAGCAGPSVRPGPSATHAVAGLPWIRSWDGARPSHDDQRIAAELFFDAVPKGADSVCALRERRPVKGTSITIGSTRGAAKIAIKDLGWVSLRISPGEYTVVVADREIYDASDLRRAELTGVAATPSRGFTIPDTRDERRAIIKSYYVFDERRCP